ncbi:MAG: hypothetical protein AAGA55_13020, partial [Planctomycetota bacterium]
GGSIEDFARVMHVSLVALGAVLFTSGMMNLLRDVLHLRPVLASSSGVGITHVLDDEPSDARPSQAQRAGQ